MCTFVSGSLNALTEGGFNGYVVGGAIRDKLLGRAPDDLDVVVSSDSASAAKAVSGATGGRLVVLDAIRGHYRINRPRESDQGPGWIDVAPMLGDIHQDLVQRDFTINAMAVSLPNWSDELDRAHLIDPLGGQEDLRRAVVQTPSIAVLEADPVRCVRAARFVAQFGMSIDERTRGQIRESAHLVAGASPERVRDEIYGVFASQHAYAGVRVLDETGVLSAIVPELDEARGVAQPPNHHYWDVFEHSMHAVHEIDQILVDVSNWPVNHALRDIPHAPDFPEYFDEEVGDGQSRATLLKMACLFHDIGKPDTKTTTEQGKTQFLGHGELGAQLVSEILTRLRCSNNVIRHVSRMIHSHLRPGQISQERAEPSRRAVFRYWRDMGSVAVDTVYLSLADYLAARGPRIITSDWQGFCGVAGVILNRAFEEPRDSKASLLLNGNQIQRHFGLKPGPKIGNLLKILNEAEALGRVETQEEAVKMLRGEIARDTSERGSRR
ncbi:MAG: HD domain-containing protein [Chloroflexi bacterium]|nr:HD domain-containing protein [Chloroflexota bacterium]